MDLDKYIKYWYYIKSRCSIYRSNRYREHRDLPPNKNSEETDKVLSLSFFTPRISFNIICNSPIGLELDHIRSRELNNARRYSLCGVKDWNRNIICIVYRIKKCVQDYKANFTQMDILLMCSRCINLSDGDFCE